MRGDGVRSHMTRGDTGAHFHGGVRLRAVSHVVAPEPSLGVLVQ
jgi:hypothetical protein